MKRTRKNNRDFLSIPVTLDEVLESLANPAGFPNSTQLAELSDLSGRSLELFGSTWSNLPAERRRETCSRLAQLAEENVELNFDAVLMAGLDDPDEQVRAVCIAGLWENCQAALELKLLHMLKSDPSTNVRVAAAQALERFCLDTELGDDQERKNRLATGLLSVFNDGTQETEIRRRALEAVAPLDLPGVHRAIRMALESGDKDLKTSSLYAMGASSNPTWLPSVISELESKDAEFRYEAARAAGEIGEEDAVPALIRLVQDTDMDARLLAISALGKIGGPDARQVLQTLTRHSNQAVREASAQALYELDLYNNPLKISGLEMDGQ